MVRESVYGCIAGRLSRHRLAVELLRILAEDDPAAPLRRLRAWGYLELVWPRLPARVRGATVEERLGSMALAMGKKGEEFLRSLPIERAMSQRLGDALRLARQKTAPRAAPAPETARLLALALPGLSGSALRPLFLAGRDLQAAGLRPGPSMGALLAEAGRAQWAGRIRSRREALS